MLGRLNLYLTGLGILLVMVASIAGMVGCNYIPPSQNLEIRTWYDLDAVRDNLAGHHVLMNDLDSSTAGYTELASPTANGGKGWQPVGPNSGSRFKGTFDGQGYAIHDLFINCPDELYVGLFGVVGEEGVIESICVVNVTVTGDYGVGGLVGWNWGDVTNSYSTGSVIGDNSVGGLVGWNDLGSVSHSYSGTDVSAISGGVGGLVGDNAGNVSDSYSLGFVNGGAVVGGLMGANIGTVSNSYSTGNVTGGTEVGGLVGGNAGTLSNTYSTGSVTGTQAVGGLVGENWGPVNNSYSASTVTGDRSVGGLLGWNYNGIINNSYSSGSVTGNEQVGGLVGSSTSEDNVTSSFWDIETSGQPTSAGGTGMNTTQMQDIVTFSGAGWNIVTVALNETNPSYIWNIVNNVTYPFLSWQAV